MLGPAVRLALTHPRLALRFMIHVPPHTTPPPKSSGSIDDHRRIVAAKRWSRFGDGSTDLAGRLSKEDAWAREALFSGKTKAKTAKRGRKKRRHSMTERIRAGEMFLRMQDSHGW